MRRILEVHNAPLPTESQADFLSVPRSSLPHTLETAARVRLIKRRPFTNPIMRVSRVLGVDCRSMLALVNVLIVLNG